MRISLIAAMGTNRVIGNENSLPWDMPADLKYFSDMTRHKPIVMGRRTFDSIGKPLPNRQNIVLTRQAIEISGCDVCHSLPEAVGCAGDADELMIIGGAKLYEATLPLADRLYITLIDYDFTGDTHFPARDEKLWTLTQQTDCAADEKNAYDYHFLVYDRK